MQLVRRPVTPSDVTADLFHNFLLLHHIPGWLRLHYHIYIFIPSGCMLLLHVASSLALNFLPVQLRGTNNTRLGIRHPHQSIRHPSPAAKLGIVLDHWCFSQNSQQLPFVFNLGNHKSCEKRGGRLYISDIHFFVRPASDGKISDMAALAGNGVGAFIFRADEKGPVISDKKSARIRPYLA